MKTMQLYIGLLLMLFGYQLALAADLSPEQLLGSRLYQDKDLSFNHNQSCATCHSLKRERISWRERLPTPAFVDPDNLINGTAVSDGSIAGRFGTLNAPSAGYAAFSPFFHWDANEGLYIGGQFWNGRAATLAEQAAGPFLNPVEMAMPSKWAVVTRLKQNRHYVWQFSKLYDLDLDQIPDYELAPAGITPPPGVLAAYDRMAKAIGEFEKSRVFNRFTSKFDFVLAGMTSFSAQEAAGFDLFNNVNKAACVLCHTTAPGIAPDGSMLPPLLTDFSYDNLGTPRNVNIPGNPEPDPGLGGRADIAAKDPQGNELGKHKVMSLRNIAITPPYGHNGVFATLEQITHFYNTRDVLADVCADNNDPGFGTSCWPQPEVPQNVNSMNWAILD